MAGANCVYHLNGKKMSYNEFREEISSNPTFIEKYKLGSSKVPNHPLLKNWQELSVKRALKEAVDNNSDYLAWTTGEQQAARYNLSKELDSIKWGKDALPESIIPENAKGTKAISMSPKGGGKNSIVAFVNEKGTVVETLFGNSEWKGKQLDSVIGKGISEKILAEPKGNLSGEGLNIGGEWAKNLYDKQVKNIVEDITGHRVEVIDMGLPVDGKYQNIIRRWEDIFNKKPLKPSELKIGLDLDIKYTRYIITDILGDGKFKAVPKKEWERYNYKVSDKEALERMRSIGTAKEETFDISTKKSTGQQAIKITPEIRAMVKGEALKIETSGKMFEELRTNIEKFYTSADKEKLYKKEDKSKIKKLQAEADKLEENKLDLLDAYNEGFKNKRPASELKKIREEMNAVSDKLQLILNQIEEVKGKKVVAEKPVEKKVPEKIAEKEIRPEIKPEKSSPQYEKLIKVVEKFRQEKIDIPVRQIADKDKIKKEEVQALANQKAEEVAKDINEKQKEKIKGYEKKMLDILDTLATEREKLNMLYSQERAKRFAKGKEVKEGGVEGFFIEKSFLKGELADKYKFKALKELLTGQELDDLFTAIKEDPRLIYTEKLTLRQEILDLLIDGRVPTPTGLGLMNRFFGSLKVAKKALALRTTKQKIWEGVLQILNMPRTIMSSFLDLSFGLRQGLFAAPRYRKEFFDSFKKQFGWFASEKAFEESQREIFSRPTYKYMVEGKLALTEMDAALGLREERFASQWAEKIPGIGRMVRMTSRAYTAFANKFRADIFDRLFNDAKALSLKPEKNPELLRKIAEFANSATGRGSLGFAEGAAPLLNAFLFSPRLAISRLKLLSPIYYITQPPLVRREALKTLFTFAGTILTILGAASLWPDKEKIKVVWDPRNSDFMKIKLGNTRLDVMGGFQQYLRLSGQLVGGKIISSTTGKVMTLGEGYRALNRFDILLRFIEMKEAPVASFATQWLQGESVTGQPFNIPKEVGARFVPMVIGDVYSLANQNPSLLPLSMLSFFGIGTQTYSAVSSSQFRDLSTTKKLTGQEFSNLKKIMQEEYKGEKKTKKELNTLFKTIQENQAALPAYESYKKVQNKGDEEIKKALGQYSGKQIKTIEKFIKDDVRRIYNKLTGKSKEEKLKAYNKLNILEKKVFRKIIQDNQ